MERRDFLKGAGIVGVTGLAGCTGGPTGDGNGGGGNDSNDSNDSNGSGGDGGEAAANIGMVYATGGLGDGSFNDQAQQGIQQAEEELGIEYAERQPDEESQFPTFQQELAQSGNYDLVCCIGFLQQSSLTDTAPQYAEQNFMIVDETVDADNVSSYVFREEQGSYLVGQMAGLLTTEEFSEGGGETVPDETTVGFVGGVEGELIGRFEAGFTAGAQAANEDVEVLTSYVGDFNDPSGGQEAALSMYDRGADIVYHAAGNTGTGVFGAAQEAGRYAIGVDRDQSVTQEDYADVILASMVKRVDTAVFDSVEAVVNDEFTGGETTALSLEEEGVAAVYGQELGDAIPGSIKDSVDETRQGIIDGEIEVPTDPDEL
ncbi:BMP family lipoprotein [Halomarina ordinaria]|uniref:BMP family protein n=1 Tax=Halomarina ordinaria TaxID=3033939 RepID=A0ABD5U4Y1_9EURY|nr:BMP family protein [Halomarina sp. PSRA2]